MGKPWFSSFYSGRGKPLLALSLLTALFLLLGQGPARAGSETKQGGKAPDTIKLDSLQGRFSAVIFDHSKHARLAEGCYTCHHEHPVPKELTCSNCHKLGVTEFKDSVKSSFMPCRNCHNEYVPKNPGMPGLKVAYHKTCFKCHAGMGDVGMDPRGCSMLCHAKNR
jgi:hypothetical protein